MSPDPPGLVTPPCGWWDALVGPGRVLDTERWFVVAPNVLGGCQGSTGPSSLRSDGRAWGGGFPFVTQRDQVAVEAGLADELGVGRWALVVGGSMGGMRALEWAVTYPERTDALLLLATSAAASAEQIAWADIQLHAIRSDPHWHGGDYHDSGRGPTRVSVWPAAWPMSPTAASRSWRSASAVRRRVRRTRGTVAGTRSSRISTITPPSWCAVSTRAAMSPSPRP